MLSKLEGKATLASFAQSENALLPMAVTPAGMVTLVSDEQPRNKLLEMELIPDERVRLVKDVQKENAPASSVTTLAGMFKLVNPLHR